MVSMSNVYGNNHPLLSLLPVYGGSKTHSDKVLHPMLPSMLSRVYVCADLLLSRPLVLEARYDVMNIEHSPGPKASRNDNAFGTLHILQPRVLPHNDDLDILLELVQFERHPRPVDHAPAHAP